MKSITVKHLALVSSSLTVLLQLYPRFRALLCSNIPAAKRALLAPELDRLETDLRLHRDELYNKIILIMKDRLQ